MHFINRFQIITTNFISVKLSKLNKMRNFLGKTSKLKNCYIYYIKSLNPEGEVSKCIFLEYMAIKKTYPMVTKLGKSKFYKGKLGPSFIRGPPKINQGS